MAREQWLVTGPKTIDIETVREVRANLVRGAIRLIADEGSSARVEVASVKGRDLKVAIEGDILIIDHPQLTTADIAGSSRTLWEGPEAVISVRVPKTAALRVRTAGAEVLASGTRAAVNLATVTGDVFVDDVHGPARLATSGGEVSVRGHRGSIIARSLTGDLVLSGAIDVADVITATGQTIIDVAGVLPDRIAFQSASGGLTLRLPQDAAPSYVMSTVTGRIEVDGQSIKVPFGQSWRPARPEHAAGVSEILVSTFGGRIAVVRGADTRAAERLGLEERTPVGSLDATLDADIDEQLRRADEAGAAAGAAPTAPASPASPTEQGSPPSQAAAAHGPAAGDPSADHAPEAAAADPAPRAEHDPSAAFATDETSAADAADEGADR